MKNLAQPQPQLKGQRDLEPVFVKTVLAVLFALGLLMIFAGVRGISAFNASGYDAEAGFSYVYQMKGELDKHYQNDLAPVLDSLEAQEQAAVSAKLDEMLLAFWTDTRGDEAAARAELDAFRPPCRKAGRKPARSSCLTRPLPWTAPRYPAS